MVFHLIGIIEKKGYPRQGVTQNWKEVLIDICLKVSVYLPLLKKHLLQTIIPCVDVQNYVTCCEVLKLTYFPLLSGTQYYLFMFSSRRKEQSISVWRGINHKSHFIHETGNSKEGCFHINLAWSSKRCEHLYDEMKEDTMPLRP